MPLTAIGDLAQALQFRRQSAAITQDIARLSDELTTGRTRDLVARTSGATAPLSAIESSLARVGSYAENASAAVLELDAAQGVFETIGSSLDRLGATVLAVPAAPQGVFVERAVAEAVQSFESIVSQLNTSVGGRSLFAGSATQDPPLPDATTILAELTLFVAAAAPTDAATTQQAVEDWFSAGGGFELTMYQGSDAARNAQLVGKDQTLEPLPSVLDPGVRQTLSAVALAAVSQSFPTALTQEQSVDLLKKSGDEILTARSALTKTAADIGRQQAVADSKISELQAETALLERAMSDIVSVDPFEVATKLQATESQLDLLYSMIARQSRLSLTSYLS